MTDVESKIITIYLWGIIVDSKVTGLYANQGKICPVCETDAGVNPIRLDFCGHDQSKYFHRKCASQLKNEDDTFFSSLRNSNAIKT